MDPTTPQDLERAAFHKITLDLSFLRCFAGSGDGSCFIAITTITHDTREYRATSATSHLRVCGAGRTVARRAVAACVALLCARTI